LGAIVSGFVIVVMILVV